MIFKTATTAIVTTRNTDV